MKVVVFLALASTVLAGCAGGARPGSSQRPASADVPVPVPAPAPAERADQAVATAAAADPTKSDTVSRTDVAREAEKVFGDTTATAVVVEADSAGESEEITWDIDVRSYETKERVEYWVRLFTGEAKTRIEQRLSQGSRYDAMIRGKLRAAGLPEDMIYLSLIESGFNPHAYSRAAAVGLWQFMTPTARGSGLRVDWWVDERRDPVRSTDAAMRFINYLKNQFGSLYVAAAAYNGGPGRMARGLKKFEDELEGVTGDDVFFALAEQKYLPAETKDYVPKLIAAALVGKNPERYGMSVKRLPPFAYDSVVVPASTPLAAVAKAVGVPVSQVTELNTHILRGVTPPVGSLQVRIPVGSAASFDSAFRSLDSTDLRAYRRVKAKKKQTLAAVASAHGMTAKQLAWYNPKVPVTKAGRLRTGEVLRVPTQAVLVAALDVPDPEIAKFGGSNKSRIHIVKRGENLSVIARKYKTTVNTIMRRNGLKKPMIFAGQSLVVSGAAKATKPAARKPTATKKKTTTKASGTRPAASKAGAARAGSSKGSAAKKPTSRSSAKPAT